MVGICVLSQKKGVDCLYKTQQEGEKGAPPIHLEERIER
jgi:hypothetical protein